MGVFYYEEGSYSVSHVVSRRGVGTAATTCLSKMPYSEIDGSNDGKIGTSPHPSPGSIARGKKGYFTVKSSQDNVPLRSIEDTVTITLDSGKKISYKVGRMIGADEKLYVRIVLPESVRERKDPHKKT